MASTLYRASLRGTLFSVSPPALVRDGHLFVPLDFAQHDLGVSLQTAVGSPEKELRFFGRWAKFAVGRAEMHSASGACTLPAAPFAAAGVIYVPAELLQEALGIGVSLGTDASGGLLVQVSATGARTKSIHLEEQDGWVRLIVDLASETVFQWQSLGDSLEISLPLPSGEAVETRGFTLEGFENPHVTEVSRSLAEGFTQVNIGTEGVGQPTVTAVNDPPRLVIDLPVQGAKPSTAALTPAPASPSTPTTPPLPPGAPSWQLRHFTTERGPIDVYVLQVGAKDPQWRVRPALAADTVHTRHSVAFIGRKNGAAAAINGGFFAAQGPPMGMLVIDGEWISSPILNRTTLAADASGEVRMGRWDFRGQVQIPGRGYLEVTDLNRNEANADELIVYTSRWASSLPGDPHRVRLAVSAQNVVVLKETEGRPVEVPDHGYLISAQGKPAEALRKVEVGETARIQLGTAPPWPDLWWAVEGGPRLLVDGEVKISSQEECFRADICEGSASRSAVGITKSGDLLLVAVEDPTGKYGAVTLRELAMLMRKLGAYQAMNLDGGGSTTVAQNGETVNRVRGDSRLVSNALVVVPR